jgi:LysR family transcriptional regulator, nitrogen assimilation regulatory protein
MDLRALRYFVAAANLNSISKAANQLGVAQPALSRQIRKLEHDLGAVLLHRDSRGIRLTEAGAQLLEAGTGILAQVEDVIQNLRGRGQDGPGRVSVAIIPSITPLIAPLFIERMRQRHPSISVRLSEGLTKTVLAGLLNGEFELGLIPGEQEDSALVSVPLLTEPMFLIGPGAKKPQANDLGSLLSMQEVAQYPLLLPSRGNTLREQLEAAAKRSKIKLDVKADVDSYVAIKRLIVSGLGYTIHCYSFVREEVERGQLFVQSLRVRGLSRQWRLARLRDNPQSFAAMAAAKLMIEIAAEFSKRKDWYLPKRA